MRSSWRAEQKSDDFSRGSSEGLPNSNYFAFAIKHLVFKSRVIKMSLHIFSSSPLRTFAPVVQSTCRFNSTSSNATNALESLLRPSKPGPGKWHICSVLYSTVNLSHALLLTRPVLASGRLPSRRANRQRFIEDQRAQADSRAIEKFQTREWKAGDIYAPHDLSPAEMMKWRKRTPPTTDVFDAVKLNPLTVYKVRFCFYGNKFSGPRI